MEPEDVPTQPDSLRKAVELPSAVDDDASQRAEDHALVRRAQAGDEDAFAALVQRHQARAWRVARNLVPSDEDAHDLAQEAFVRVFKNLSNFDFDHGFTTWLYRIVTNLSIDHLRRRRPVASTTSAEDDENDFDFADPADARPGDGLEHAEVADEVRAVLGALAPHFQSVLVLREMEGLPCNEIAKIVGATHVTVRWRLHRGRKLFQDEWERRVRFREAAGTSRRGAPGANSRDRSDVFGDARERSTRADESARGSTPRADDGARGRRSRSDERARGPRSRADESDER